MFDASQPTARSNTDSWNDVVTSVWTARTSPAVLRSQGELSVREINDRAEFASLRPTWNALLAATPRADFFHTLEWLEMHLRHGGDRDALRLLVMSRGEEVVGLMPLVVTRDWNRLGPFRVLTYPLAEWGSSYGPIGPDPDAILAAGLKHVAETRRQWDFLELRSVHSDTAGEDATSRALTAAGLPAYKRHHTSNPIIDLTSSWESYWRSRSGNWRSNCTRNERRLERLGELEYFRYRPDGEAAGDADPRWDLYEQCEQIARVSWQGSSTNGTTLTHDQVREFLHDLHEVAVRNGSLDLNLLYVDGQPAAFQYNYIYRGHISCLRLGFHPAFNTAGAGTVLMYLMLRDSFVRGDRVFDFLPGSFDAKRPWQTSVESAYRYSHYRRGRPRQMVLRLKRWLEQRHGS